MIRLVDKGREFKRYRPSSNEKMQLAEKGLQWVLSSNVSAIGTKDDDLIIRFHNGSLYKYFNVANLLNPMLNSNSKGHYVWVNLRRKNIPYSKIGSIRFKTDKPIDDTEVFENIRTRAITVEEPQLLDERDIMSTLNIFTVGQINILDDLLGPSAIKIISNIRQI